MQELFHTLNLPSHSIEELQTFCLPGAESYDYGSLKG